MEKLKVTNDFVFKKLFGKQENEELLKDLLEAIIEEQIEKIEVQKDASLEKTLELNKMGILDIKATLNNNTIVNIEVQVQDQKDIIERSLFYWAGLYHDGLYKGDEYQGSKRTISINILGYNCFEEGSFHEIAKIRREYKNILLTEDLEMHYIQIPKFIKEKRQTETRLDQWIQFIGNINEKGVQEAMEKNEVIKKAKEELEYLTGDEEIRRLAELRDKAIRDEKSNLRGAREEGEAKRTIEIAKEMLKNNCSVELVITVTGLSEEKIKKLIGKENSQYLTGIEEEKRLDELRDKAIRDEKSNLRGAREDGMKEGEAKGRKEGKIEVAKEMLKQNCSVEFIVSITKLTKEEIERL